MSIRSSGSHRYQGTSYSGLSSSSAVQNILKRSDMAFVAISIPNGFVVYDDTERRAVLLPLETALAYNIVLGDFIRCDYIPYTTSQIGYKVLEVTEKLDYHKDNLPETRIEGDYAEFNVAVNLSKVASGYESYGRYCIVYNTEDIGLVTMLSSVKDGIDGPCEPIQIYNKYKNKNESKSMICYCRYVYENVPQSILTNVPADTNFLKDYHWRISSVEAPSDIFYSHLMSNSVSENIAFEDEIAREKMIEKQKFMKKFESVDTFATIDMPSSSSSRDTNPTSSRNYSSELLRKLWKNEEVKEKLMTTDADLYVEIDNYMLSLQE